MAREPTEQKSTGDGGKNDSTNLDMSMWPRLRLQHRESDQLVSILHSQDWEGSSSTLSLWKTLAMQFDIYIYLYIYSIHIKQTRNLASLYSLLALIRPSKAKIQTHAGWYKLRLKSSNLNRGFTGILLWPHIQCGPHKLFWTYLKHAKSLLSPEDGRHIVPEKSQSHILRCPRLQ